MDAGLKQRLIGASVLVALAVIFLPMLVKGPAPDSGVSDLPMRVPEAPQEGYRTVDLPLVVPPEAPSGGVLPVPDRAAGEDSLPLVDTSTASPDGDIAAQEEPASAGESGPAATPAAAAAPAATDRPATPTPASPAPDAAGRLPPTAAGGDYAVHFGAFSSERDAQLIVRQLAGAGLTAYAEPFNLNGRPAQRVRLGPYASREAAEVVRVRAAQVRDDVSPRVVALDAADPAPRQAAQTPAPPAATPAPASAAAPAPTRSAAAPAPAVAASGVGYAVQVGAFSNAADATRLRDRLRGLGITAFTDTVDTDKGRLTRVKAGPVPTREEAERLKSQLRTRAGLGDGLVRPHP